MTGVDAIKVTVDELIKALSARNIIGEPMEMEDKIIIPITKIGMGFGTGQGREEAGSGGRAGGAGGGLGVFPVAVVIVFKGIAGAEGVKVIPLSGHSTIAKPVSSLADTILEKVIHYREEKEKKPSHMKPSHMATVDIE